MHVGCLGADPKIADAKGYCACMHATQYGRTLVLHLIKTRCTEFDMKRLDAFGHTLVHWAAYKGMLRQILMRSLSPIVLGSHTRRPLKCWGRARRGVAHATIHNHNTCTKNHAQRSTLL